MRNATRLPSDSSTSGTGDALDDLEHDHRAVDTLFARVWTVAPDERVEVVAGIVAALTAHAELEEQVAYPAIADVVVGGDELIARARAEHAQIKALLDRVSKADAETLATDLRALQTVVLQHVSGEEAVVFPAFRSAASARGTADLTAAALAARGAAASPSTRA
jgi:hemerythrin superfamily protein